MKLTTTWYNRLINKMDHNTAANYKAIYIHLKGLKTPQDTISFILANGLHSYEDDASWEYTEIRNINYVSPE